MNKKFCDLCEKEIIDRQDMCITVYDFTSARNILAGHAFCARCGKPVLNFLKKHGFIQKEKAI